MISSDLTLSLNAYGKETSPLIRDAFKSAINEAIRLGLLERDGQSIRKAK